MLRVSWRLLRKQYAWLKQLRPHQVRGVKAASSTNGFAILFAQRTGKTWVTGGVIRATAAERVLLVGPKTNLESTWVKFFQEKMEDYTVCRNLPEYLAHRNLHGGPCVLILNPEAVTPVVSKLRKAGFDYVVWDEAQRLKNRTSRSSRDAMLLARSIERRLALTGTPMDLSEKDLWAIMRFVNPEVFGDTWKDFDREFLVQSTIDLSKPMGMIQRQKMMLAHAIAKRKAPVREDMKQVFADRIAPYVMRISKEEAGITSAKIHKLLFQLTGKQKRMYEKLERTMVVKAGKTKIKTPLKITQIGKLQQITGGHIKDEEGKIHVVGRDKKKILRSAIEKYAPDEPFVIFVKYVWEIHEMEKMLRGMGFRKIAKLWGKVKDIKSDKRRTNMLLAFQRGEFDVMVCQQKTGGVGVDLYHARKAFVYSMGHSFIDWDQMLSRLDFLQQLSHADFYILLAQNTIDTDIYNSVKTKKSITEIFYDRLNNHRRDWHNGQR